DRTGEPGEAEAADSLSRVAVSAAGCRQRAINCRADPQRDVRLFRTCRRWPRSRCVLRSGADVGRNVAASLTRSWESTRSANHAFALVPFLGCRLRVRDIRLLNQLVHGRLTLQHAIRA